MRRSITPCRVHSYSYAATLASRFDCDKGCDQEATADGCSRGVFAFSLLRGCRRADLAVPSTALRGALNGPLSVLILGLMCLLGVLAPSCLAACCAVKRRSIARALPPASITLSAMRHYHAKGA